MPSVTVVERDYPGTYQRFTALGPLMEKLGNAQQGHQLEDRRRSRIPEEAERRRTEDGATKGMARIETDIDATAKSS